MQVEEVAKLELAEARSALQQTANRMAMLESRAKEDADRYLLQGAAAGSTVDQVYGHLDAMDRAIAARKGLERVLAAERAEMEQKRAELLEAMQYRKKLDLLEARALDLRRRRERQDQQLLDERAWRRSPLQKGERA